MTKDELIRRIKGFLKDRAVHDTKSDIYTRGYVDACKNILKLAKNLDEEDCACSIIAKIKS